MIQFLDVLQWGYWLSKENRKSAEAGKLKIIHSCREIWLDSWKKSARDELYTQEKSIRNLILFSYIILILKLSLLGVPKLTLAMIILGAKISVRIANVMLMLILTLALLMNWTIPLCMFFSKLLQKMAKVKYKEAIFWRKHLTTYLHILKNSNIHMMIEYQLPIYIAFAVEKLENNSISRTIVLFLYLEWDRYFILQVEFTVCSSF